MASSRHESTSRAAVPPPQRNYEEAAARALMLVRKQPAEELEWLGARRVGDRWELPILDDVLTVELQGGAVRDSAGRPVGPWWRVLALHYLAVPDRPKQEAPATTFADLPSGRSYVPVYRQRVIERLCRTAGRDRKTLRRAGEVLGGKVLRDSAESGSAPGTPPAGDLVFEFQVFPRVQFRVVWFAGDEELAPSASVLMPGNIESFLPLEDIVVLSERLIARLGGGRF